jgi:hypothetical protein
LTNKFLILFLTIILIVFVFSCAGPPSISTLPPSSAPNTRNVVDGVITIPANEYYEASFTVNTTIMHNARVVGTFEASGGAGDDIEALIITDAVFAKWTQGHNGPTIYDSGKLTASSVNVTISDSGVYHLIFDNSFSLISSKEVTAKLNLVWSSVAGK